MSAFEMTPEVAAAFRVALKEPIAGPVHREGELLLDRERVEELLPHRDPFLLVDRVHAIDDEGGVIVASYDLSRARDVFGGHFPGHPVWPGVLQIEAIGQAGLVLYRRISGEPSGPPALTHVRQARFIREVRPGGEVEIRSRMFEDGLFVTFVGQCLRDGQICSVAAVSAL